MVIALGGPSVAVAAGPYQARPVGPSFDPTAAGDTYSVPSAINDAGQVLGTTSVGTQGRTWVSDPATGSYRFIGVTDADHTAADGTTVNGSELLAASGAVAGRAVRFLGRSSWASLGEDAWAYDPATGTAGVIGLADAAHTAADGTRRNDPVAINAAGVVVGDTVKVGTGYDHTTYDAWTYSPVTRATRQLGLTDAGHSPAAGGPSNRAVGVNAAGQVVGTAASVDGRYGPYADGTDAWVYTPATNTYRTLGLTDAAHQGFYGPTHVPVAINRGGQVIGTSDQTVDGTDAWVDPNDGGPARLIGLTDAVHAVNGGSFNTPLGLTDGGRVDGWAQRYGTDGSDLGRDAWAYSPATGRTEVIGLTDADHTSSVGAVDNEPAAMNADGQVVGYARRYAAGFGDYDLWLFDPASDRTAQLDVPDGWLASDVSLNDAGQVVGNYTTTDELGRDAAGWFSWTAAGGFQPLALPDGFVAASNPGAVLVNDAGQIAAAALPSGRPGSSASFLLTPVPEPATAALLAVGVTALLGRRRERMSGPGRFARPPFSSPTAG